MRTEMNYAPGYGASPSTVMEHDLDPFTAGQMLRAAEEIRALTRDYAAKVAEKIGAVDLWCEEHRPAWASPRPANVSAQEERAARFLASLDELVDEQLHQGKLEEAGEIV